MRILAVDPGGTTGVAYANFEDPNKLPTLKTWMPRGFGDACELLTSLLHFGFGPVKPHHVDLIALEKFTITAQTAKKSTAGSKLDIELCGVVKYLAWQYSFELVEQSPGEAMNFVKDEKLRWLGWYTSGPDHARDATRHLLLAAVTHKQLNPRLLLPGHVTADL